MPPWVDCNLPLYTAGVAELSGIEAFKGIISLKPLWFLGYSWNFNFSATKSLFKHIMPRPCRALIHTRHAAPLPCSDSALSFVKFRMVAGSIRTG